MKPRYFFAGARASLTLSSGTTIAGPFLAYTSTPGTKVPVGQNAYDDGAVVKRPHLGSLRHCPGSMAAAAKHLHSVDFTGCNELHVLSFQCASAFLAGLLFPFFSTQHES